MTLGSPVAAESDDNSDDNPPEPANNNNSDPTSDQKTKPKTNGTHCDQYYWVGSALLLAIVINLLINL